MDAFFCDFSYSPDEHEANGQTAVRIARKIRDILRDSNRMPRYKVNVQAFLGERKDQKISIVAKGFWDNYLDSYTTYTYMGDNFYCSMVVWGVYTD
jgi:hypothetical protein